jgi:hypothetical protein
VARGPLDGVQCELKLRERSELAAAAAVSRSRSYCSSGAFAPCDSATQTAGQFREASRGWRPWRSMASISPTESAPSL